MISFFPFLAGIGLGFLFGLVAQSERHAARSAPVEVVRSLPSGIPTAFRRKGPQR